MDSIMSKLSEIEHAATSIVEHAESQKAVLDQEYAKIRQDFDDDLEAKTQSRISRIRSELETHTSELLSEQDEKNRRSIELLRQEYEQKHTLYAEEILKRITEV